MAAETIAGLLIFDVGDGAGEVDRAYVGVGVGETADGRGDQQDDNQQTALAADQKRIVGDIFSSEPGAFRCVRLGIHDFPLAPAMGSCSEWMHDSEAAAGARSGQARLRSDWHHCDSVG